MTSMECGPGLYKNSSVAAEVVEAMRAQSRKLAEWAPVIFMSPGNSCYEIRLYSDSGAYTNVIWNLDPSYIFMDEESAAAFLADWNRTMGYATDLVSNLSPQPCSPEEGTRFAEFFPGF
jgi:hypothetical protein